MEKFYIFASELFVKHLFCACFWYCSRYAVVLHVTQKPHEVFRINDTVFFKAMAKKNTAILPMSPDVASASALDAGTGCCFDRADREPEGTVEVVCFDMPFIEVQGVGIVVFRVMARARRPVVTVVTVVTRLD